MYLPPELVRAIINYILDQDLLLDANASVELGVHKKRWPLIQPLTLACKVYRALSLEAWFHTLFLESPADIPLAHAMFPEIKRKWTKLVHQCALQVGRINLGEQSHPLRSD